MKYICNECNKEYNIEEEPDKCICGADDFGIHDCGSKVKKNETHME